MWSGDMPEPRAGPGMLHLNHVPVSQTTETTRDWLSALLSDES